MLSFKTTIQIEKRDDRWFPWVWTTSLDGICVGSDVAATRSGALRAATWCQRRAVLAELRKADS